MLWDILFLVLGFGLIGFVAFNLRLGRAIDKGRKWAYLKENPSLFWTLVFSQTVVGLTLIVVSFFRKN